jgi:hypothetical protein
MKNEFTIAAERFANAARHGFRGAELLKTIEDVLSLDENADRPHTLTGMQRCSMLTHAAKAAIEEGKIEKAWSSITQAIALAPYQENTIAMTAAIAACTRKEPSAPIVLIISCHPRVEIAKRTKLMLQQALGDDFRILIVVGQTTELRHRSSLDTGLLTVDAPDNYESLPLKIRAALEFVYRRFKIPSSCFKIDEDIEVHSANELASLMRLLCKSDVDYAGFAGNNKTMQERTWHFGKCQDKKLGRRPYTKRFRGCWAYGGLYYLSTRAVQSFALESLRFPDEVAGEMYEDKYIADTLRECGIRLSALNPEEWLQALTKDWWTVNRAYHGQVLSLK